jgi:hypothetical protein
VTVIIVFLGVIMLTLLLRSYVDNNALRARELKRIADASEQSAKSLDRIATAAWERLR